MLMLCSCGVHFSVEHAIVCQRGAFIIRCNYELRDLKVEMLRMVCNDVEVKPVFQEVTGKTLNHCANKLKPLMAVWIFMLEIFRRDKNLHSSMFGCVTLMETLTKT